MSGPACVLSILGHPSFLFPFSVALLLLLLLLLSSLLCFALLVVEVGSLLSLPSLFPLSPPSLSPRPPLKRTQQHSTTSIQSFAHGVIRAPARCSMQRPYHTSPLLHAKTLSYRAPHVCTGATPSAASDSSCRLRASRVSGGWLSPPLPASTYTTCMNTSRRRSSQAPSKVSQLHFAD